VKSAFCDTNGADDDSSPPHAVIAVAVTTAVAPAAKRFSPIRITQTLSIVLISRDMHASRCIDHLARVSSCQRTEQMVHHSRLMLARSRKLGP
jgi:hypothetical protein